MAVPAEWLAAPLVRALEQVARVMASAQEPWWIIGSAAVALHGEHVDAADIDVLLGEVDARALLPRLGLPLAAGDQDARFRSAIFASWRPAGQKPALPVEFMAGLAHARGEGWVALRPASREWRRAGEALLPVPSRQELREILLAFGRDKDLARAKLLARP